MVNTHLEPPCFSVRFPFQLAKSMAGWKLWGSCDLRSRELWQFDHLVVFLKVFKWILKLHNQQKWGFYNQNHGDFVWVFPLYMMIFALSPETTKQSGHYLWLTGSDAAAWSKAAFGWKETWSSPYRHLTYWCKMGTPNVEATPNNSVFFFFNMVVPCLAWRLSNVLETIPRLHIMFNHSKFWSSQ